MFDSTSLKLISGFLGLLILGFLVFIIAGTFHINESEAVGDKTEQISNI